MSRQAIHKLVQSGRLRSKVVAGRTLVNRLDLAGFRALPRGRPRSDRDPIVERIKRLLARHDDIERRELLRQLRDQYPIHPLEAKLDAPAEIILEAIDRSGDLTVRMIRGVIAEAAFDAYVVQKLAGWQSLEFSGDQAFDFLLKEENHEPIKVQVKLQRSAQNQPLISGESPRNDRLLPGMYIVETQRTRSGKNKQTGESTRPYRFGEFDILAVAMFPSTHRWDVFRYTVADWLLPKLGNPSALETLQPMSTEPNDDWTDDFETCVAWLREGKKKTVRGRVARA